MSRGIVLIGGGGHCLSVLDTIISAGLYDKIGIVDAKDRCSGDSAYGVPYVGSDDDLPNLLEQGYRDAFVTIGRAELIDVRIRLTETLERLGFFIPSIIDPSATVSARTRLERGIFVGKKVTVNVACNVGKGTIVNTGATLEHECTVGDFAHIAPGAVLCGAVRIGMGTHVGAGSVVREKVKIGARSLIGAGSVVVSNIGDHTLAYGNPCKEVGKH